MNREPTDGGGPLAPSLILAPGQLPTFPGRNAVFIANLMGLFFGNEKQTELLAKEIGEVDSYGGRLVPILNLLFRAPDPMLSCSRASRMSHSAVTSKMWPGWSCPSGSFYPIITISRWVVPSKRMRCRTIP